MHRIPSKPSAGISLTQQAVCSISLRSKARAGRCKLGITQESPTSCLVYLFHFIHFIGCFISLPGTAVPLNVPWVSHSKKCAFPTGKARWAEQ